MPFKNAGEANALVCPDDKASIEVWHETEPGFGVRVMRKNKRSGKVRRIYLCRYQNVDGKDVRKNLGELELTDYKDALFACQDQRRKVELAKRQGLNPPPTLGEALFGEGRYLDAHKTLAPDTVDGYTKKWNTLKKYHNLVITELNIQWWKSRHTEIEAKHGISTAHQVCRIAHTIYNFLLAEGIATTNPIAALKSYGIFDKPEARGDYIRRAQMPLFWHWLHHQAHPGVRDYMLFELFSGFRMSVVGSLKWSNYDMENKAYKLRPDQRGNKKRRLVWFPVPDWLHDNVILPRAKAPHKGDFIIPSHKWVGKPLRNVRGSFAALKKSTGLQLSNHSLRRTFATLAHATVKDVLLVSRLLTHAERPKLIAVPNSPDYIQPVEEDIREAVNALAQGIVRVAEGKPLHPKEDAKAAEAETAAVVPM
ncbi:MAG: tyrosine-type recombinase/integrase [Burkholderiales bacterium]